MNKMVMVVYNEAIEEEVMEALKNCSLNNYTKIATAYGKGTASGAHLGNDIWPGRNNILFVACQDIQEEKLILCIKQLRKQLGSEGVKAFVLPLEEIT